MKVTIELEMESEVITLPDVLKYIEELADDILDFTESNPFGTY